MSINTFNSHSKKSEAEIALTNWDIKYKKQSDGTILVKGNLNISHKGLTKLPDLTNVIVEKSFYCDNNKLTSIEGSPKEVGGDFYCYSNKLTNLKGAPKKVSGEFSCSDNELTSLEEVSQNFWELKSDLGTFIKFKDIPEKLLVSPETIAQRKKEKEEKEMKEKKMKEECDNAAVVKKGLKIKSPIKGL